MLDKFALRDDVPIYINGRFLAQPTTGVQRFAREITEKLRGQYGGRLSVLGPAKVLAPDAAQAKLIGINSGHLWEQVDLPRYSRRGILVNLGNTAPLAHRRQLVVIHDAGAFATPEAYSKKFIIWYRLLHRLLSRWGTEILTVSEFSKAELLRVLKVSEKKIHVVRPGADHMGKIAPDYSVLVKNALPDKNFVLVVATLAAHKNLAALSLLAKALDAKGVRLVIAGAIGGAAFNSVNSGELPWPATYLGRVTDAQLKALYETASCLVMPSLYEGFGLPAVEAMACGCPVVVSDIPALRETCGTSGIYFSPHSPADIADAVTAFLASDEQRKAQSGRVLEQVATMTWANAAQGVERVIAML